VSNPPKQKGTGGETELLRLLGIPGLVRNPSSAIVDLSRVGWDNHPIRALATRPDRGRWLFSIGLPQFKRLVALEDMASDPFENQIDIEVKRYRKFAHHSLYEGKFS
jgi:hypothetical protein